MSLPRQDAEDENRSFVSKLYWLAKNRNDQGSAGSNARQRLAELRAGVSFTPQGKLRMIPAFYHCAGELPPAAEETAWHVVAALFATAPEQRLQREAHRNVTLAQAFGKLWRDNDQNESIEKRFLTLANTRLETLPAQLRHAVRLLDSHAEEFDWYTLPRDLRDWGRSDRRVQNRWLRQFYGAPPADGDSKRDSDASPSAYPDGDEQGDKE